MNAAVIIVISLLVVATIVMITFLACMTTPGPALVPAPTYLGDTPMKVAAAGDTVSVYYVGKLEDGTVFDKREEPQVPFSFPLGAGKVILGWDEGVVGMAVGEVRVLEIPPEKAYGSRGVTGAIPPNATLIFHVKLVSVNARNTGNRGTAPVFVPAPTYRGTRPGYVFTTRDEATGYYRDETSPPA